MTSQGWLEAAVGTFRHAALVHSTKLDFVQSLLAAKSKNEFVAILDTLAWKCAR